MTQREKLKVIGNRIYTPHLGFTLRVLLSAAGNSDHAKARAGREFEVVYNGAKIGTVQICDNF